MHIFGLWRITAGVDVSSHRWWAYIRQSCTWLIQLLLQAGCCALCKVHTQTGSVWYSKPVGAVHILLQACTPSPEVQRLRSQLASPELAEAVGGGLPPIHTPSRQLLFWDFCEALVRIAHLKFRHLPSLQQRLHQLLHAHILPLAVKVSGWHACLNKRHASGTSMTTTCSVHELIAESCCLSLQHSIQVHVARHVLAMCYSTHSNACCCHICTLHQCSYG